LSSILKALKKIEDAAPAGTPPGQAAAFEPQSVFRSRLREKKIAARGLIYGAVAAGLVLAAVAVYRFLSLEAPPAGSPSPPAISDPAAGAAKQIRGKIAPAAPAPSPAAKDTPAAPPVAAATDPGPQGSGTDSARPPNPQPIRQTPEVAKPMRTRSREPAAAPAREERPFAARREANPAESPAPTRPSPTRPAPAKTAEDALDRLDESRLRVMAIAWSPEPARRIAVINGRIIKEGESVDGFSVTGIRKGDVIVTDGSKSWRVEFNLKAQP
jgi:hypothetical protein